MTSSFHDPNPFPPCHRHSSFLLLAFFANVHEDVIYEQSLESVFYMKYQIIPTSRHFRFDVWVSTRVQHLCSCRHFTERRKKKICHFQKFSSPFFCDNQKVLQVSTILIFTPECHISAHCTVLWCLNRMTDLSKNFSRREIYGLAHYVLLT